MCLFRVRCAVLIGLLLLFCPGQVQGQGLDTGSLAQLFVKAEEHTGVPSGLLASIAIQESSFRPWSVNLAGQGFHEDSLESAMARVRNSGVRSFDLGLMQINVWWLKRFDVSVRQALDPARNVVLGSLILKDCLSRYGLVGGVSCYHSGSPDGTDGRRYARKVLRNWKMLENGKARVR